MQKDSLTAKTFWVMVVTVLAKLLAFVRTAVCAALFGATWQTDAFYMAQNIIGMLSGLSSSLQVSVVPIRTQVLDENGQKEADKYVSTLINLTLILSVGMGIAAYFFAPQIVRLFAPEFFGETYQITIVILRIFLPIIILMSTSSVLSGVLNTHGKFVPSNLVGIAMNFGWLCIPLLLTNQLGIYAMVAGYLLGSALQIVIQWPHLKRIYHYSLAFQWKSKYFIKTIVMSAPIFIGTMVTVINQTVDKALASGLIEGSVSALGYAVQLNSLVSGIIIVPIMTTIFTSLSRFAQLNKFEDIKRLVIRACSVLSFILLPITLISLFYKQEIILVVFQRGMFDAQASFLTSSAFIYYIMGILPMGISFIITHCFIALHDSKTPLYINMASVGVNITFSLILVRYMQIGGLALATSVATLLSALAMMIVLKRKIGAMGYLQWLKNIIKMGVALIPMAVLSLLIQQYITAGPLVKLVLATIIGGIAYMSTLLLLRQQDALHAKQIVLGLLHRKPF